MKSISHSVPKIHLVDTLPLFAWADTQRLAMMPLGVRVLARKRNLPPWRAIALAEIANLGGVVNG